MAKQVDKATTGTLQKLPTDRLRGEIRKVAVAYGQHAVQLVADKAENLTNRLTDYAENGGGGLKSAATGEKAPHERKIRTALTSGLTDAKEKVKKSLGGKRDGGGTNKITNIVEYIDVGVPIDVAYNQWTQFQDFPSFMKKVESADQPEETKVKWKAQVFWSHRTWESTIVEQIPDDHIVWKSSGDKGYVDGVVTFHELAPNLTRILVVLEYHPKGFFEQTGNLWRAQGRRVRLELKHFHRQVMTQTLLHPEDVEGWRGAIRDSEVIRSHDDAMAESEDDEDEETAGDQEYEDEGYDGDDVADDEGQPTRSQRGR